MHFLFACDLLHAYRLCTSGLQTSYFPYLKLLKYC